MANIKFSYLYRDGGNYKKFNSIVFENPDNTDLKELVNLIRSKLIDETWFYASQWLLPELFLDQFDQHNDPTWHEYEGIVYSDEPCTASVLLKDFIKQHPESELKLVSIVTPVSPRLFHVNNHCSSVNNYCSTTPKSVPFLAKVFFLKMWNTL